MLKHTSVTDHAENLILRAWILNLAVVVTAVCSLESLQKARIVDAVRRNVRRSSYAAPGLLNHSDQNEPVIDSSFVGHLFDGVIQISSLLIVVVGLFIMQITAPRDYVCVGNPQFVI